MANDFSIAEFLAWCRTKPADERYCYVSNGNCAVARFLRETGITKRPHVTPGLWRDGAEEDWNEFPEGLESALTDQNGYAYEQTFGALVKRLEAIVTPSVWTDPQTYLDADVGEHVL